MTATKQIKLLNKLAKNLETAMNEIEKKAEQLADAIFDSRMPTVKNISSDGKVRYYPEERYQKVFNLILQFATEVAEMQRSACVQQYYDSDNKHGTLATIADTPLVTETNTEK